MAIVMKIKISAINNNKYNTNCNESVIEATHFRKCERQPTLNQGEAEGAHFI